MQLAAGLVVLGLFTATCEYINKITKKPERDCCYDEYLCVMCQRIREEIS